MRHRLLSGATLLAAPAATMVALAGVASATPPYSVVFDSPSSVTVDGVGADTVVSYTNASGHDLICFGMVGDPDVVAATYEDAVDRGDDVHRPKSDELKEAVLEAAQDGRLRLNQAYVLDGQTVDLWERFDEDNYPGTHLVDASFEPAAYVECFDDLDFYVEVEVSAPEPPVTVPGSSDFPFEELISLLATLTAGSVG